MKFRTLSVFASVAMAMIVIGCNDNIADGPEPPVDGTRTENQQAPGQESEDSDEFREETITADEARSKGLIVLNMESEEFRAPIFQERVTVVDLRPGTESKVKVPLVGPASINLYNPQPDSVFYAGNRKYSMADSDADNWVFNAVTAYYGNIKVSINEQAQFVEIERLADSPAGVVPLEILLERTILYYPPEVPGVMARLVVETSDISYPVATPGYTYVNYDEALALGLNPVEYDLIGTDPILCDGSYVVEMLPGQSDVVEVELKRPAMLLDNLTTGMPVTYTGPTFYVEPYNNYWIFNANTQRNRNLRASMTDPMHVRFERVAAYEARVVPERFTLWLGGPWEAPRVYQVIEVHQRQF